MAKIKNLYGLPDTSSFQPRPTLTPNEEKIRDFKNFLETVLAKNPSVITIDFRAHNTLNEWQIYLVSGSQLASALSKKLEHNETVTHIILDLGMNEDSKRIEKHTENFVKILQNKHSIDISVQDQNGTTCYPSTSREPRTGILQEGMPLQYNGKITSDECLKKEISL